MPDPTNPPSNPDSAPISGRDPKPTRRRFLQGGLAAAPVLMTLVSRPVLAQQCTTPSGFVSLNASTAGRGVACLGRTPGYWKNHAGWPAPYQPSTTFDSVFAHNATYYSATTSLQDVLEPQVVGAGPPHDLARHIVSALLNAQSGWTPVLTPVVVKGMWSEYLSTGSFSPSSGIQWSHDDLVSYLLITMPL